MISCEPETRFAQENMDADPRCRTILSCAIGSRGCTILRGFQRIDMIDHNLSMCKHMAVDLQEHASYNLLARTEMSGSLAAITSKYVQF